MARTKAVLGTGARLSDYLSASLLARVYPPALVRQTLNEHGVNSQRIRSFPAFVVIYYCMALSLYPEAAYEAVFAVVTQALTWMQGGKAVQRVSKSSISAARRKMGYAPLQALHESACVPLADAHAQPHAFYAGYRLVAMDGSTFEIPDTAANAAAFGYPGSRTGHAAYPQAQCATLIECGTHAILGGAIGPYRTGERELGEPLLDILTPDMLCLADRGFRGYLHWKKACKTGAQLLWRFANNQQFPVVKSLPDGSYLSAMYPKVKSKRDRANGIVVRVIEYTLTGAAGAPERFRLLTTLLDHEKAPAIELAQLYHERWEVEAVFDELKTHLTQRRRTLRSKTPEGVRQEFYGWMLAHYAVCWLMHQSASEHRLHQRRLSFTGHVHLLRRAQPQSGAFPPRASKSAPAMV
jgi:hypothetical protein